MRAHAPSACARVRGARALVIRTRINGRGGLSDRTRQLINWIEPWPLVSALACSYESSLHKAPETNATGVDVDGRQRDRKVHTERLVVASRPQAAKSGGCSGSCGKCVTVGQWVVVDG